MFTHTPYDGSATPFSIGLKPLDLAVWIEPGGDFASQMAEKDRLLATRRDDIVRAENETADAQAETLALLADHLPSRHPDLYRSDGDRMHLGATGTTVDLDADELPLVTASRLVAEDFVIMVKGATGYRLAAAVICFPSSWSLAEKFRQPMGAIHARVPGYPGAMEPRVDRIFDNLSVDRPLWRMNWSIYGDADLHHPRPKQISGQLGAAEGADAGALFIRVERQTLRRLPVTGDILFMIRIHHDPMAALAGHPEAQRLAGGLRTQLLALDAAQLAYKNLTAHRDAVAAALAGLAGA